MSMIVSKVYLSENPSSLQLSLMDGPALALSEPALDKNIGDDTVIFDEVTGLASCAGGKDSYS